MNNNFIKNDNPVHLFLNFLSLLNKSDEKTLNNSSNSEIIQCAIILIDNFLKLIFKNFDYWKILNEYFAREISIRYTNTFKIKNKEKTYLWIFLELYQKNLNLMFTKIYKTNKLFPNNNSSERKFLKTIIEKSFFLKKIEILNDFSKISNNFYIFINQSKLNNSFFGSRKNISTSANVYKLQKKKSNSNPHNFSFLDPNYKWKINEKNMRLSPISKKMILKSEEIEKLDKSLKLSREFLFKIKENFKILDVMNEELLQEIKLIKNEMKEKNNANKLNEISQMKSANKLSFGIRFLSTTNTENNNNNNYNDINDCSPIFKEIDSIKTFSRNDINMNFEISPCNRSYFISDDYVEKPSEILFKNYEKYLITSHYFIIPDKKLTIETQNFKCAECPNKFNKGILSYFKNDSNYCEYFAKWYCDKCFSEKKAYLPWKLKEELNGSLFPVSKTAFQKINDIYNEPILEIEYENSLLSKNMNLYEFMIKKRQIHFMYDLICDITIMEDILQDKINFALKKNLFSMKNLIEILNGAMFFFIVKSYDFIIKHFNRCEICLKKGLICQICKDDKKIFHFNTQETIICEKCNNLYHKKCLNNVRFCPLCNI